MIYGELSRMVFLRHMMRYVERKNLGEIKETCGSGMRSLRIARKRAAFFHITMIRFTIYITNLIESAFTYYFPIQLIVDFVISLKFIISYPLLYKFTYYFSLNMM